MHMRFASQDPIKLSSQRSDETSSGSCNTGLIDILRAVTLLQRCAVYEQLQTFPPMGHERNVANLKHHTNILLLLLFALATVVVLVVIAELVI
jgi:hypothetical protein